MQYTDAVLLESATDTKRVDFHAKRAGAILPRRRGWYLFPRVLQQRVSSRPSVIDQKDESVLEIG